MKIKSINIINGKNKWSESKDKLIHMVLDLGVYENKPSDKIEGFYERIKEYLPSLKSHRCSEGKPGGFFKRIKEGTWMGHIIEHVALELQTLAGMDTGWGRTRGVKGQKGVYNVVFNYEDKDKGKLAAREAFNVVNDIIDNKNPQIDNIVKKLKPKRKILESIRKVLREDDYSPAGKEITPNKIVIHKSSPVWRENILKTGLQASAGECYKSYVGYGEKCKPAIFATNSTNKRAWFDSTYDDDIWEIDTTMIPDVMWYKDRHFESRSKHIVTFQDIPSDALTLKYKGNGKDGGIMESKNDSNKNIIKELLNGVVLPEYDHIICDIKVKDPSERFDTFGHKPFKSPSVHVTFIGGYGTKFWPVTQGIQRMYDDVLDDIWDTVHDYTGINVDIYSSLKKDCGKKNINESIRKVLKEETNPKKEGLLNIIKDHGLYDFTKDTGLNYGDIYNKTGELPREVKIQYLKDVVDDLQQTPHELDLTFITGSIPLYDNDDWQTVYVEYLTNEDGILRVHLATFDDEGGVDDHNTIHENQLDYETLETLVTELSEKLQYNRN